MDHEYQDAATYASWGVDLLRYDNCFMQFDLSDTYARQVFPNYPLEKCAGGPQECETAIEWAYIQGYNFALAMEGLTQVDTTACKRLFLLGCVAHTGR